MVEQIEILTLKIKEYDRRIGVIAKGNPVIEKLRAIPGIGPLIALAFMLHIDDPGRFPNGGSLAKYLGLTPRHRFSAGKGYQTNITKAGDKQMRALMIQAAHGFLRCKQDSDLKRWAEALLERKGRKGPQEKVLTALARKLSRLLHHLWLTGNSYEPFFHTNKK
ncbi:MAG: transposase [Acidobacteriota bacterium]|nr:transposase [Acidobacteriota bacterium]